MARMRATVWCSVLLCLFAYRPAAAEMPSAAMALLNHAAGKWVLRGTIAGKPTTHDVQAVWVLNHEYLQLRETSREKNASGGPAYDAIIYIGWDSRAQQYACLWLDSTSGDGLSSGILGRGSQAGDSIPFVFALSASNQIHTKFSYDKTADTWQWLIDNVTDSGTERFASLTLNRVP
jgi:hypothetical protein